MWRWIGKQLRGIGKGRPNRRSARPPTLRFRQLSLQPCERRLLLSATASEEIDWLLLDFESRLAGEGTELSVLAREAEFTAANPNAYTQQDGPDRIVLDDKMSGTLDDLARMQPAELEFLWALRPPDVANTGQLPPTPWFDDEFHEILAELLVPEVGSPASDWSLQVQSGLLPTSLGTIDDTSTWESATVFGAGLSLDGPAHFQAEIIQLLYPKDAEIGASTRVVEHDYPVLYTTITVHMEWSNLGQFWTYPLAGDLVDLVVDVSAEAFGSESTALPWDGLDNIALPGASMTEPRVADAWSAQVGVLPNGGKPTNTRLHASVSSSVVHVDSTLPDREAANSSPWQVESQPEGEPRWDLPDGVVIFGPQELDSSPLRTTEVPEFDSLGGNLENGALKTTARPGSLAKAPARDASLGSTLSPTGPSVEEDVTHGGFQRLRASDLDSNPSVSGLVDLGLVVDGDMLVLKPAVARLIAQEGAVPEGTLEAAGLAGTRARSQELVLVSATMEPAAYVPTAAGITPDRSRDNCNGPASRAESSAEGLPVSEASAEIAPTDQQRSFGHNPLAEVAAPSSTGSTAIDGLNDRDKLPARFHDMAMATLGHVIDAPCESVSTLALCLVGQIILARGDSNDEADRSRLQRGPRLRA